MERRVVKKYLFFTFLIFMIGISGISRAAREGYDKVRWGAPVQKVKKVYGEHKLEYIKKLSYVTRVKGRKVKVEKYIEPDVDRIIAERHFTFLNDRLFRVDIFLRDHGDSKALMETLLPLFRPPEAKNKSSKSEILARRKTDETLIQIQQYGDTYWIRFIYPKLYGQWLLAEEQLRRDREESGGFQSRSVPGR
jgi:hypothetical protein